MRITKKIFLTGILVLDNVSCGDLHSKKAERLALNVDLPRQTAANESSVLQFDLTNVAHIVGTRNQASTRLIGLDRDGRAVEHPIISPAEIDVIEFQYLTDQSVLAVKIKKRNSNVVSLTLTSGEDIFTDCSGLILYDVEGSTSECFDRSEYPENTAIDMRILQAGAVNKSDAIYAVRTISIRGSKEKTIQLVMRQSKSNFKIITEAPSAKGMEFVSQSKLGLLTSEENEEGERRWFVTAGTGPGFTRTQIELEKLIGESDGCFHYIKKRTEDLAVFCPFANATLDTLVTQIPRYFDPSARVVSVSPLAGYQHLILNEKGQSFIIENLQTLKERDPLDLKKVIIAAQSSSRVTAFLQSGTGLSIVDLDSGDIKEILLDYRIDSFRFNREENRIVFVGFDLNGKGISGSVGLDGSEENSGHY